MPVLIVFLVIVFTSLIIAQFSLFRRKRYETFVINNSRALRELKELNDKYVFYRISDYIEKHTYDNEKFYDNISCEDYLIYQLQFKQNMVKQEVNKANYNNNNFNRYCEDLSKINCFENYDKTTDKFNKKLLCSIETKLFARSTKAPVTEFKACVILYCAKINGSVYASKRDTFNAEQIKTYIRRLNNKNGYFYNDRGIWDSICRVERGKVSNKIRFSIYERDGYRCRFCGRSDRFEDLEIDHIKPIAKGGKSTYDNLQTLCKRCNKEKGNRY